MNFVLGVLLLFGAILGSLDALEGLAYSWGSWNATWYVIYLLAFIYIGVIGFKLSSRFGEVTKQAQWIFLLQVPLLSIPATFTWIWSTGLTSHVGYIDGQFSATLPMLEEVNMSFHYPAWGELTIGVNLVALLLAYFLHLQSQNKSTLTLNSSTGLLASTNTFFLKKHWAYGFGAALLAILMIMFSAGILTY